MKNKDVKGTFKRIEREIMGNPFTRPLFDRDISVIIPDTSAMIDLQKMTREHNPDKVRYSDPEMFLEGLERDNRRILVPECIMQEIYSHAKVRINENTFEISQKFVRYLERLYNFSKNIFYSLKYGADSEQVGLEIYWASKFACDENVKKQGECFSDVDKQLLKFACLIGTSKLDLENRERDVSLVHILSSDEHILKGTKFMREQLGYSNINCVNFRGY